MKRDLFNSQDKLLRWIDDVFSDQLDVFRLMNEQIIWRNLLYYCDEHYIEFLRSSRSFRRRVVPDYLPTPVSNEIREFVRSQKAIFLNQKMVPKVWPNTNEKEDQQAADAGENLLVFLDGVNDGGFKDECEKNIIWLCISGTAFMRTYPDADGGLWMPTGEKTGGVARESIIPFNVRFDTYGDTLQKKRWVGIQSLKDKEWVEDTFKTKIENAGDNKAYLDYQKSLTKLVGSVSPWKGQVITAQKLDTEDADLVLFKEVEFQPTAKYPNGLYVCSCAGKILQKVDRLPILPNKEYWDYSLTDFHYNYVPGRYWSDAPISDLISPQNIINEIDQALMINRRGIGRPKIITPGEVGLKKIGVGGHGFLALSYNPIMGQKPEFKEGTPLSAQVLQERIFQKEQFQDIAGDPKNIMKGQAPSANASGILTQNLRETAERGKQPDIDRYNRSLSRVYKKTLLVAQEVMTEERMLKITGRGNKVKIMKFKGADLRGNTDVRLELDSGLITTNSGKAEMLVNLVQAGFFKDQDVSPSTRQEVMTRLGMTSFTDEIDMDVERAEAENLAIASGEFENVMTTAVNPDTGEEEVVTDDPLFSLDNHPIHAEIHRKYIISPEFKELPQQCQVVLIKHQAVHQKLVEEAPPDIRDYVQIDKILAPGILTVSEREQILVKYLGIQPGDESETGIPSADVVLKSKEKIINTKMKEAGKERQMEVDFQKHMISEGVKASAVQAKKSEGRGEGSKPKSS